MHLDYDELVDALATMKNASWIPDPNNPPFLVISPDVEAVFMKDTKFVETSRFYGAHVEALEGEKGVYTDCRVLVTPLLNDTGRAYVVFPSNTKFGTVAVLAWKRKLRMKSERYETKEHTFAVMSARVTPNIVQSLGIMRINITSTL